MVEVVTMEEFNELRASIEERLDAIDKKLDNFIKEARKKYASKAQIDKAIADINARIDRIEEASRSFIDRLIAALRHE